MFDWIKKHIAIICVSSLIIILGIPFIIHLLFKIQLPADNFWAAKWSAGDILSYYGSVLAFIGTVVLGILALYQNHIIKTEADKRAKILEQKEVDLNKPKFSLKAVGCSGNGTNLSLVLINISENIATDIVINNVRIIQSDESDCWKSTKSFSQTSLRAGEEFHFNLSNNIGFEQISCTLLIEFKCEDKYSSTLRYIAKGNSQMGSWNPPFKITEI